MASNLKDGRGRAARSWPARAAAAAAALVTAGTAAVSAQSFAAPNELYLRAGAVLDRPTRARFTDRNCASELPAALYGCGAGLDGAPLSTLGSFGTTAGYELGVGYAAGSALRIEAVVAHRPRAAFEGRANFVQTSGRQAVSADVSAVSAMLAAYLDLPALGLPRLGPFAPFVGGGAGVSRVAIGETRMEFPRTTTIVPGGRQVGLAWMPAAGVATALGPRVTLDIAWRYTHLGAVDTGRSAGRIVWRDGRREPLEIALAETTADLAGHGLVVSMRYAF